MLRRGATAERAGRGRVRCRRRAPGPRDPRGAARGRARVALVPRTRRPFRKPPRHRRRPRPCAPGRAKRRAPRSGRRLRRSARAGERIPAPPRGPRTAAGPPGRARGHCRAPPGVRAGATRRASRAARQASSALRDCLFPPCRESPGTASSAAALAPWARAGTDALPRPGAGTSANAPATRSTTRATSRRRRRRASWTRRPPGGPAVASLNARSTAPPPTRGAGAAPRASAAAAGRRAP